MMGLLEKMPYGSWSRMDWSNSKGKRAPFFNVMGQNTIGIVFEEHLHNFLVVRIFYECFNTRRKLGLINHWRLLLLLQLWVLIVEETSVKNSIL